LLVQRAQQALGRGDLAAAEAALGRARELDPESVQASRNLGLVLLLEKKYPEARLYQDWREMLHKEKGQVDAACVGTPDSCTPRRPSAPCAWACRSTSISRWRTTSTRSAP
jgi:hypothetical protein